MASRRRAARAEPAVRGADPRGQHAAHRARRATPGRPPGSVAV